MSIPARWENYSNAGTVIESTPFIALKTPLAEKYNAKLPNDKCFNPGHLKLVHPNLSVVIDLTNTNRYYKPESLAKLGIQHIKIPVPGRVLPHESLVAWFYRVADDCREQSGNGSEQQIIGVHCTHGINRTGYFLCRYLIERMGVSAEDAIRKFETARGYHMERPNYVDRIKLCVPYDFEENDSPPRKSTFRERVQQPSANWRRENFRGASTSSTPNCSYHSRNVGRGHRSRIEKWNSGWSTPNHNEPFWSDCNPFYTQNFVPAYNMRQHEMVRENYRDFRYVQRYNN